MIDPIGILRWLASPACTALEGAAVLWWATVTLTIARTWVDNQPAWEARQAASTEITINDLWPTLTH